MNRLTTRNSEGIGVLKQPFECERCGDLQWSLPDLGNGGPIDRLAEYEDIGLTPEQIRAIDRLYAEKCKELAECNKNYLTGLELANITVALKKLREYEDMEKKSKLIKLPCAVGDKFWDIDSGRICSYEVTGFYFGILNDDYWEEEKVLDQVIVCYTNSNGSITGTFAASEIGSSVFLTKEAAEGALKGQNQETV